MPFTTSHTALVFPLKRMFPRLFSLSGLMAGAMSPDLIYFFLVNTEFRNYSHTWAGLFYICIPAGLIFCYIFHNYFKYQFIRHLPSPFDKFLSGLAVSKWPNQNWLIITLSVLIGALSHFGWDAITHPEGQFVKWYPQLNETVYLLGAERKICRIIQHASSLIGGLVLIGYFIWGKIIPGRQSHMTQIDSKGKLKYWFMCILFTAMFCLVVLIFYNQLYQWHIFSGHYLFFGFMTFALGSWAGAFWWAIIYGIWKKEPKFIQ